MSEPSLLLFCAYQCAHVSLDLVVYAKAIARLQMHITSIEHFIEFLGCKYSDGICSFVTNIY